jgi:general secretion pathway protein C
MKVVSPGDAEPRSWAPRAISILGVSGIMLAIMRAAGWLPNTAWQGLGAAKRTQVVAVTALSPFSQTTIVPAVPKESGSRILPNPLTLILVSVVPGRTAPEWSAQIGVVRESPQTYMVGAMLENGARLMEIQSDYVVLQKDGRTAWLYLSSGPNSGQGDVAILKVDGNRQARAPARITSREALTDYIRPSPVYDGDNLLGYEVYPGVKMDPFARMGLQPGDVITEIDGAPLTDPGAAWDILHELMTGGVLLAVVKRRSSVEHITLDGSLLVRAEESRGGR